MKGCLCVGTMSERVTEMSHAQANMMLDLVLSDGKVHADLDAKALVNLAEAAEVLGRSEDAELLLSKIKIEEITPSWEGLAQVRLLLNRNPENALEIMLNLVESIRGGNDSVLLSGALNLLSQSQAICGDIDTATETQYESLAIKSSSENIVGQANAYHNLLQFAKQNDDLELALSHASRIVELVREMEDREWEMNALADFAHLLACDEQFDKSEQNYRLSIDLSEELEDLTAAVISHWGIADLAMIRGDGQMAMEHYSQALASQIQTGTPAPPELIKRIDALTGPE